MDQSIVTLITNRLDSIDRSIAEERRDSADSRRRVYEKLESQDAKLDSQDRKLERFDARLETLEKALLTMSPAVADYVQTKQKVVGAGRLGAGLWRLGGFVLTAASGAAGYWAWMQGLFTTRP